MGENLNIGVYKGKKSKHVGQGRNVKKCSCPIQEDFFPHPRVSFSPPRFPFLPLKKNIDKCVPKF
jgi:hypothetical protein